MENTITLYFYGKSRTLSLIIAGIALLARSEAARERDAARTEAERAREDLTSCERTVEALRTAGEAREFWQTIEQPARLIHDSDVLAWYPESTAIWEARECYQMEGIGPTISICRRDFWSEKLMRDFVGRLGGVKKCNVVEVKTDGRGMMKVRDMRKVMR